MSLQQQIETIISNRRKNQSEFVNYYDKVQITYQRHGSWS